MNLLQAFGPLGGLVVTYAGLLACFLLLLWWERRFFARGAGASARVAQPVVTTEVLG